ncbi:MAG: DoxX family protein, partial [Bacteroidales bacterium]
MKTTQFLVKFEPQLYALLRIVAGFLFLWHGSQKLFGVPPAGYHMSTLMIIAGIIEFVGGLFIMTGFLTRWAAFISSGQMAFAYWSVHGLHAILPIVNK